MINIKLNSKEDDLKLAKKLLIHYQKIGDKKNIAICKRNIKNLE